MVKMTGTLGQHQNIIGATQCTSTRHMQFEWWTRWIFPHPKSQCPSQLRRAWPPWPRRSSLTHFCTHHRHHPFSAIGDSHLQALHHLSDIFSQGLQPRQIYPNHLDVDNWIEGSNTTSSPGAPSHNGKQSPMDGLFLTFDSTLQRYTTSA
jgi:hypothetical protein